MAPGSDSSADVVRVVHISDLHVGRAFNGGVWESFLEACRELRPDVIAVTGDLVDTPFRRTLRAVGDRLAELKTQVGIPHCQVLVVPGNHDTRVLGLLPLFKRYELMAFCAGVLLAAVAFFHFPHGMWTTRAMLGAVVLALGMVVLQLCCGDVGKMPGNFVITEPTIGKSESGRVSVVFYPFDSARRRLILAGGDIAVRQFLAARSPGPALQPVVAAANYRIALVHHHPMPIPYDNPLEETMILRNAGAFLKEIDRCGVSLVLHGHKHHWNFTRVTTGAEDEDQLEVGILGGSTLTRGRVKADGDSFGFNLVVIDALGHATITRHESSGGSFTMRPVFSAETVGARLRRLEAQAETQHGLMCDTISSQTAITVDGDGIERIEYKGFRVLRAGAACDSCPRESFVSTSTGYIECFEAAPLDDNAPRGLCFERKAWTLSNQTGLIRFGRTIHPGDAPFGFYTQCHAINTYAMSAQQFTSLYPGRTTPPIESSQLSTPAFPVRVMHMSVGFPPGFQIAGSPDLEIMDERGARLPLLEHYCRDALDFDRANGLVHLTVSSPPVQTTFRILWKLTWEAPPEGRKVSSLQGRVRELRNALVAFSRVPAARRDQTILLQVGALALELDARLRAVFGIVEPKEEVGTSLMVFDERDGLLRLVVANAPSGYDSSDFTLHYGDGIAGRAYKTNGIRHFVKARAEQTLTPFYFYPRDGQPGPGGIDQEAVLSIPLTHPEDGTAVYGILNCSSRRASSRLIDLESADIEAAKFKAINQFCFEALCRVFNP